MGLVTVKSSGSRISMVSSGVIPGRKMMAELSRGVSTSGQEIRACGSDTSREPFVWASSSYCHIVARVAICSTMLHAFWDVSTCTCVPVLYNICLPY